MSDTENTVAPSIGRIVLVRGEPICAADPWREYPAIITRVVGQNFVDVTVFKSPSVPYFVSVQFHSNTDIRHDRIVWRWPPQVQQNAKAAALPETTTCMTGDTIKGKITPWADYSLPFEGSFGWALAKLRDGCRLSRAGWNGKGMWLYLVPANSYPAQTEVAKRYLGMEIPYRAYIAMKTVDNDVVPWVASQTDILAEDWCC